MNEAPAPRSIALPAFLNGAGAAIIAIAVRGDERQGVALLVLGLGIGLLVVPRRSGAASVLPPRTTARFAFAVVATIAVVLTFATLLERIDEPEVTAGAACLLSMAACTWSVSMRWTRSGVG